MCGITGYIHTKQFNLEQLLPLIAHRGPDGSGVFYDHPTTRSYVGFGHVRLSIIDPQACSNQPLFSSCGNYVIVYNGEIYNYRELRKEYLPDYSFKTNSDTEVVLALYSRFGADFVKLLSGMFAFAIYDKVKGLVLLARDQLGIKPLYLSRQGSSVFFGSEIKVFSGYGIKPSIDESLISEFLLNGFIYEPDTGFSNVQKLAPGNYVEIYLKENATEIGEAVTYWRPGETGAIPSDLEGKINASIERHLVADVPVGLFFSGGVDSSILLKYLGSSIRSLTVKPEAAAVSESGIANDYHYACIIADKLGVAQPETIPLQSVEMTSDEFLKSVAEVAEKNEELIADYTFISSQLISGAAARSGLKVVLSGMGADELFGGYPRYVMMRYYNLLQAFGKSGIYRLISKVVGSRPWFQKKIERFNAFFEEKEFIFRYTSLVGYFPRSELNNLLKPEYAGTDKFRSKINKILTAHQDLSPLKKSILLDLYGFLSHNFSVADKSSMDQSIEVRVPLATHDLADHAFNLPDSALVDGFKTKSALKKILEKYLSKDLVHRSKTGFNPPLDNYIRRLGMDKTLTYFTEKGLFNYCQADHVKTILSNHYSGRQNNTYKIYSLLFLTSWLSKHSRDI